jgi:putative membrane protein insertion efficiency factor
MPELSEEAVRKQRDLRASRPAGNRRVRIVLIAFAVLAIAALCDWVRPPSKQISVVLYNTIIINGYRTLLRPVGNSFIRCPYNPTCSAYSKRAMETHGFLKGLWLTTSRLFRCMPWVPFGTNDPVPPPEEELHPKGTTEHKG